MKKIKLLSALFIVTTGVFIATGGVTVNAASYRTNSSASTKSLNQVKKDAETELKNWKKAGVLEEDVYSSMSYMLNMQQTISSHEFYFNQFKNEYGPKYEAALVLISAKK